RIAAAWVCLLTVAFLYAPLAGALLLARGADCCVGGYCKVPTHHHEKQKAAAQQVAEQPSAGEACDHEKGSGSHVTPCKMSCCPDTARPALMPVAFVLPVVTFSLEPAATIRPVTTARATEISRFARPLSPPPRLTSSLL